MRKYGVWKTGTGEGGNVHVEKSVGSVELSSHEDGVYEIEFSDGEIGLVLETDFYGQHAIVASINIASPAARFGVIKEGDVLIAVNDTIMLHEPFQDIIAYISRLKEQAVPRRLRFLNPLLCPVAVYEERMHLARRDQKDMFGFVRTLEYLLAERQYAATNMQKFAQRDLQWFQYLKNIGGVQNLKRAGVFRSDPELKNMVRKGVPVAYRPQVWMHLCGAQERKMQYSAGYYQSLLGNLHMMDPKVLEDIEKDVERTFPEHDLFRTSDGCESLRRVLKAYAMHNPEVGYCQSLNFLVGMMLLFMDEESAFWLVSTIVEKLLPPHYYSKSMIGVHVDQYVFAYVIQEKLPKIHKALERSQLQLPLITLQWFLCLFVNTLPTETALRVWDMFFNEGDKVLFRIAVGLLKMHEAKLLAAKDSGELFSTLRDIGRDVLDADLLIASSYKIKKRSRRPSERRPSVPEHVPLPDTLLALPDTGPPAPSSGPTCNTTPISAFATPGSETQSPCVDTEDSPQIVSDVSCSQPTELNDARNEQTPGEQPLQTLATETPPMQLPLNPFLYPSALTRIFTSLEFMWTPSPLLTPAAASENSHTFETAPPVQKATPVHASPEPLVESSSAATQTSVMPTLDTQPELITRERGSSTAGSAQFLSPLSAISGARRGSGPLSPGEESRGSIITSDVSDGWISDGSAGPLKTRTRTRSILDKFDYRAFSRADIAGWRARFLPEVEERFAFMLSARERWREEEAQRNVQRQQRQDEIANTPVAAENSEFSAQACNGGQAASPTVNKATHESQHEVQRQAVFTSIEEDEDDDDDDDDEQNNDSGEEDEGWGEEPEAGMDREQWLATLSRTFKIRRV